MSGSDRQIGIIDHDDVVERELATLAEAIGSDLPAYRNHIYRVLTYAMHFLNGEKKWQESIAFALVYHDVGMWTAGELAYLEPSEAMAERARRHNAPNLDSQLIHDAIHWHHKVTAFTGPNAEVVNAVRKADWIDATEGRVHKGLSARQIDQVEKAIPTLGFSQTLMRLAADLNHGNKLGGLWRVMTHVYKF